LELKCPQCGASNEPDEYYCGQCGFALVLGSGPAAERQPAPVLHIVAENSEEQPLDGERKTVTALFADIKGSMDLMEDLDPEEARAIVDPALKLMIEALRRYDGYVVQSTGDGIFALFGAPLAHEDHPQRALYAALRMQDEIRRYGDKLLSQGAVPIEIRVGVNTGEVVVRSIQTGEAQAEYTPIGHTANLAARMQAVARSGSVVVSEPTQRLVEGYFTLKAIGPTRVRGVSEAVPVYEVIGLGPLRTRLQASVRRGLTRFVGRDAELQQMRRALEPAKAGHGQIVAAIGEPGVGKSRLFLEFKAVSQSHCMVLETFSVSHGKASAYLPVIDLLHSYFDITSEDGERKRREKVAGKIAILDRALEDTLPYLFSLLGIVEGDDRLAQMDGQVKKRRTLEAIKRILLRESLNQPLMVVFEDLHWIDGETQALLNLLADGIANARVLLMVNYRPEYHHEWGNRTYYTQLRLDPLGKENADEMLSALLGDAVELVPLKQTIIERTQGNPFFIEELVQALFEEGALVRNGTVKLTRSVSTLHLPPTTQGVLAGRIDRLPEEQKELLQTLAVLGKEFSVGLIRRVVQRSDPELNHILAELQLAEFIYERPAVGDVEYIFKHALTQEVAYNSVLNQRRKLLHQRTGQALESMFAESLDDHLSELAHHYSRSGNDAKAVEYLGRAGQQALRRSAYLEAISSLTAAIDVLHRLPNNPERTRRELALQLSIGPALFAVKGWASGELERAYIRARELCERVGDVPELLPSLFGLWLVYLVRCDLRTAYQLAEDLLRRAERVRDPSAVVYAHYALGETRFYRGNFLAAKEHLEIAISFYDAERHRALSAQYASDAGLYSLEYAAFTLWFLGYPDQALKRCNEGLALAQRLSDPLSLALAQLGVGLVHRNRGEVLAVQDHSKALMALSAEHGLIRHSVFGSVLRGWALVQQGCNEEGIALIEEGLASRTIGDELNRPALLVLLAEAYRKTSRLNDGLNALREALAVADELEVHHVEAESHRLRGELLLEQNSSHMPEARICFQRAIEVARQQGAKSPELRSTTSLARLLAQQGCNDEARAMLATIYGWFTEGFDTADLKDAKALLDELGN
jgi:class 3 adenylate cyclase/predicted ATPase